MRNTIIRILREYTELNEITLTEIFIDQYDIILSEGSAFVRVPSNIKSKLDVKLKSYYNWPPTINNMWCSNIKEKFKEGIPIKSCSKKFNINLTTHWIQRLFRTSENNYQKINPKTGNPNITYNEKIVDPDIFEGIELFFNSKNKINDFIDGSKTWDVFESKFVVLKSGTYQTIIELKKEGSGSYVANFITQIKGAPFFDTPQLKKSRFI